MNTHSLPVAITMGDACGIGPEIALKCFADARFDGNAVIVGDAGILTRDAARLDLPLRVIEIDSVEPNDPLADLALKLEDLSGGQAGSGASDDQDGPDRRVARIVPVLPASRLPVDLPPGRVDAAAGRAAYDAVRAAARLALAGDVAAVVTAPLHKEALAAAGVPYPGHTEMLAALAGLRADDVAMMLVNDELRTILATIHMPLVEAIRHVTRAGVLRTIRFAHHAVRASGVERPRVAVAGLNPHAGEGRLFGDEDADRIAPAIADARAEGIDASGPWPGDTVFARARHFRDFDIVVAMYHDQGLIPIKYLGIDTGVNVTVGLPFVRTSVDHGTAFDIAGRGMADHRSLLAAIRVARQMAHGA